ncbi:hypothetical protein D9M68_980590 [compost metagenome]
MQNDFLRASFFPAHALGDVAGGLHAQFAGQLTHFEALLDLVAVEDLLEAILLQAGSTARDVGA